jgi:hypothetical protein|tara:strand:+ start:29998 stop:30153 length:156 start_codon:yes stop_codon:yes gene_type:complete
VPAITSLLSVPLKPCAEEAIYNILLVAEEVDGHRGKAHALPIDKVKTLLSQ